MQAALQHAGNIKGKICLLKLLSHVSLEMREDTGHLHNKLSFGSCASMGGNRRKNWPAKSYWTFRSFTVTGGLIWKLPLVSVRSVDSITWEDEHFPPGYTASTTSSPLTWRARPQHTPGYYLVNFWDWRRSRRGSSPLPALCRLIYSFALYLC